MVLVEDIPVHLDKLQSALYATNGNSVKHNILLLKKDFSIFIPKAQSKLNKQLKLVYKLFLNHNPKVYSAMNELGNLYTKYI